MFGQCSFKDKDLIGSGTYAKVYKGKIRGVDVAIKVPNLEKILPRDGRDEEDSGGSSPSSFISASESEPRSSAAGGSNEGGAVPAMTSEAQQHIQLQKVKGAKKRRPFGFFRKQLSMEKDLAQLAIGGGPASMGIVDNSHSEGGEDGGARSSHDNDEYESFGEDGADDSAAEGVVAATEASKGGGGEEGKRGDEKNEADELNNVYSDRFQNFLGEVRMLRELNHPNICLLMGTCFVADGSKVSVFVLKVVSFNCRVTEQAAACVRADGRGSQLVH